MATTNQIQVFQSPQFGQVRTAGTSDNPLFCLADLCKAVGLSNPSSVKARLDAEDVQLIDLHALNSTEGIGAGNTVSNFVTESGFYDVLLQSSSPKVKPFRKWVTSEVLPSIRKTGGYSVQQLSRKELLQLALEAEEEKERLQLVNKEQQQRIETLQYTTEEQSKQIQQNQHKVEYFDNTLQNSEAITIETIAKSLGTCPATLNKRLASCGFQYRSKSKQWFLKSPYDALGLHHDDTWTSPHGTHKRHYTKFFETGKLFITMLHNNNYDIRTTYKQYISQQQLATL